MASQNSAAPGETVKVNQGVLDRLGRVSIERSLGAAANSLTKALPKLRLDFFRVRGEEEGYVFTGANLLLHGLDEKGNRTLPRRGSIVASPNVDADKALVDVERIDVCTKRSGGAELPVRLRPRKEAAACVDEDGAASWEGFEVKAVTDELK